MGWDALSGMAAHLSWPASSETPSLSDDEVHVWCASLEIRPSQVKTMKHILSADELSRAGRYYFQKDRDHFIAARGILRTILGRYVDKNPEDLRFCCGPNGKPALEGETEGKFRFNVSRSHGLSLFAVTLNRSAGVDLEYIRPDLLAGDLAEQILSPRELLAFKALLEHERPRAFFTEWTRKEAYLKAQGWGLSADFKQFEVVPEFGSSVESCMMNGSIRDESPWLLMDLAVSPEYAAALVVEGHDLQLKCLQWENA
jgi:4'-phosphopantetheinyl transferase